MEWICGYNKSNDIPDNWGIRFDTSTPQQEKLEELMFGDDKLFNYAADWNGDNDKDDPAPET